MTTWLSSRIGERWLFWCLVTYAVNQTGMNLLRPMVSYRALDLGVDPASLGLLSASFAIAPLIVALRIGRWIDAIGERPFILAGTVVMGVAGLGLAAAGEAAWIFVLFALLGLGHLMITVAVQGMVARGSDERSYDARFAALTFTGSVGQLGGPIIAGLVAGQGSPEETGRALMVGGLVELSAVLAILMIRSPAAERQVRGAVRAKGPSLASILRTPGVLRAIVVSTTVLSAIDIMVIYLPALGEERGWTASLVGLLLALRASASMLSRLALGPASRRFSRKSLLTWSMVVSAISLVAIPLAGPVPFMAVLMLTSGAGLGIGQPLSLSWIASLAAPGARATALSVRLMGNRVGQVALPVLAGTMALTAGAAGVLGVTGLVVGLSLALVYGGLGRKPAATTPTTTSTTTTGSGPA